jgi:LPXTG-site transpeptidase (sortase) family protein
MSTRLLILLVTIVLAASACSSAPNQAGNAQALTATTTAPEDPLSDASPDDALVDGESGADNGSTQVNPTLSPLAARVTTLDPALYDPADHVDDAPAPVSISIASLDVASAPVVHVGVEDNGFMEVPGADAVGWYRFNPKPGQEGSSVLAAHISYNGTPGVFRYLSEVDVGDRVVVGFEDGSRSVFEIVEVAQYDKQELPLDRVFAKTGDPTLTLITCGGDFNRTLRSYEDNFVAYAVPIET